MANEPAWDLYRSFLEVLRTGSLSAAARSLGLTQPTVGRHIVELQSSLSGRVLFTRSPTGLIATPAAIELRPHAEAMAAAAASFVRAASGAQQASGTVRITASEVIGAEVLPAILAKFQWTHRDITIELVLNNKTEDMLRRDADIAIRMVRPVQKALTAKRIGKLVLGFHAHRRYIESRGMPRSPEDLQHHTLIGFDKPTPLVQNLQVFGKPLTRDLFNFRTDNDLAYLAAIRAGVGIGVCQYGIARRDPDLLPVLPGEFSMPLELWVVAHEDQKKTPRIRLLFDHLAAALMDYAATSGRA
ncbi:MAG: LysR family transcriptional regulator [Steroidobacteraceae bacterium]